HGLVEQRHSRGNLPAVDEATALPDARERQQLRVAESFADRSCLVESSLRGNHVSLEDAAQADAVAQVSALDAVESPVVEQPPRALDPTVPGREFTPVQEPERQPERR